MLQIAHDFALPDDAVTQTFGVIGKRGSGKTYATSVIAEEMIGARLPVAIVDPLGVWWGLRSSVDGTGAGLPVVIFGGKHADIPLEPTAGKVLAEWLAEDPAPCILDLNGLSKAAQRRFMTDFAGRLYEANELPLMVIFDEADMWAPQRPGAESTSLLGAMEDFVRRGRGHGLGCILPTQRPAVIHKDVLTQIDTLLAFRLTGPQDHAAVADWVRYHADRDTARTMLEDLPSLPTGEGWLWSPGWLEEFRRIEVRERTTYDSSATPKMGSTRREVSLSTVDLDALLARMSDTIDRALQDDPAHLRAQIADLEARLDEAKTDADRRVAAATLAAAEPERIHVLDQGLIARLDHARHAITEAADAIGAIVDEAIDAMPDDPPEPERDTSGLVLPTTEPGPLVPATPALPPPPLETRAAVSSKVERSILNVLAQFPGGRTRNQLSILTGYSSTSGSFAQALAHLRAADRIEPGWPARITAKGIRDAGPVIPLPRGAGLLHFWFSKLTAPQAKILRVFVDERGHGPVSKTDLAKMTGYSATSGSFAQALAVLRGLCLVNGFQLDPEFEEAIR